MNKKITIGSRGSKLALIYAQIAKDKIIQNTYLNEEDILIKEITTKGDQVHDMRLSEVGGKGLFSTSIENELNAIGIFSAKSMPPIERHAIACPALPLCGLAITEAERLLPNLISRIEKQLKGIGIKSSILFRMTGCPNGCARPYMAELALVGSGVDQYQLWLGGSPNLERLAKPYIQKLDLDKLEATLEPLFIGWREAIPSTSFGDYISTLKDQTIITLIYGSPTAP